MPNRRLSRPISTDRLVSADLAADNMEVRHRQQLRATRVQPLGTCVSLALGAVPVAAGVVRDGLMTAAAALIAMTAESRGAAARDGVEHLTMLPGHM
jgi:hypothetical protein